jgi:uncharacterized protein YjbJ (UPF0337 family)
MTLNSTCHINLETDMNKNRIEGASKQAVGTVKQVVGKATGDAALIDAGTQKKAEGKVQSAFGGVQDAVKDALKK